MQHTFVGRVFGLARLRREISEFLLLPLVIAGGFCAVAALLAFWDNQGSMPGLRAVAGAVVEPSGATAFVGVVAASLMTVTSITFTVLLIAVQQTSSFLGAVVFDQYLRRRANQVYVGYFVGATSFAFIVLACAGSGSPPVVGACATLLLTIGSLVALLLLIHSTVDQMRPECVVAFIHDLAVRAHEREVELLTGTRRVRRTGVADEGRAVTTRASGYVVAIDAQALAAVAREAGPAVEVFLPCQLGTFLESGEVAASIVGIATDDDRFDDRTRAAFTLDDTRRVEVDSGYSIDQLENIALVAGAGASPFVAGAAVHQLRDLVGRWALVEEDTADRPEVDDEPLPLVYTDGAIERVVRSLSTMLIATSKARQTDASALLVSSFAHALPRLRSEPHHTSSCGPSPLRCPPSCCSPATRCSWTPSTRCWTPCGPPDGTGSRWSRSSRRSDGRRTGSCRMRRRCGRSRRGDRET